MGCVLFISIVQFSRINSALLQRKLSYQIFSFPSSTFLSTFRFQFVAFVSATSISYQMISIWSSTFLSTFFWSVAVVSATNDMLSDFHLTVKYEILYIFQFVAFVSATSISYQMIFIWSSTFLSTFFWSVALFQQRMISYQTFI